MTRCEQTTTIARDGTTVDVARKLDVSRATVHSTNTSSHTVAVLRVRVETDDDRLLAGLTSKQVDKLRAGIVCTRYQHGVSIAWGLQTERPEMTSTFDDLHSAVAWLLERAQGLVTIALLCPGTSTAIYSLDRAAFLGAAATLLRRYADRLWSVE